MIGVIMNFLFFIGVVVIVIVALYMISKFLL